MRRAFKLRRLADTSTFFPALHDLSASVSQLPSRISSIIGGTEQMSSRLTCVQLSVAAPLQSHWSDAFLSPPDIFLSVPRLRSYCVTLRLRLSQ